MQQGKGIDEKGRIRAELLGRRDSLPPVERRRRSERVSRALRSLKEYRRARRVMFYVAVRGEVETECLIRECLAQGKEVSVPCCEAASGRISAFRIADFDRDLARGCYGIPEPVGERRKTLDAADIDLFVIPGIGFDLTGVRLGWGKGYYDSFLAAAAAGAIKIGLAYEAQVLSFIEEGDYDVAMDKIITEERVIDCRKIRDALHRQNDGIHVTGQIPKAEPN